MIDQRILYSKVIKTLTSCKSHGQFISACRYAKLAEHHLSDFYNANVKSTQRLFSKKFER